MSESPEVSRELIPLTNERDEISCPSTSIFDQITKHCDHRSEICSFWLTKEHKFKKCTQKYKVRSQSKNMCLFPSGFWELQACYPVCIHLNQRLNFWGSGMNVVESGKKNKVKHIFSSSRKTEWYSLRPWASHFKTRASSRQLLDHWLQKSYLSLLREDRFRKGVDIEKQIWLFGVHPAELGKLNFYLYLPSTNHVRLERHMFMSSHSATVSYDMKSTWEDSISTKTKISGMFLFPTF